MQSALLILLYLCKLVSLCLITQNCNWSSFVITALTNLFRVKITAMPQTISASRLHDIVRPEKLELYEEYEQCLVSEACESHKNYFIQTCTKGGGAWTPHCEECKESEKYHTRTPGFLKVEWQEVSIVALCSKTYYYSGKEDTFSCKGVIKC